MIIDFDKKWNLEQNIRIKFMNGDKSIQDKVRKVARRWIEESEANIKFDFVDVSQEAEVRIEFGKPTVSLVGNELLNSEPRTSNLTLAELNSDGLPEWKILHEFGHVLGLIHEIFNPLMTIKIKDKELKDYYMGAEGFDEATFEANIGRKYRRNETQYFDFDKDSIMMYHLPASTNESGKEYPQPADLSQKDKELLKLAYPETSYEVKDIKPGDEIECYISSDQSRVYL